LGYDGEGNMSGKREDLKRRAGLRLTAVLALAPFALICGGCAHQQDAVEQAFTRVTTPRVPVFINGPAALLLSSATNYSARVTIQPEPPSAQARLTQGELLVRGNRLLFAPAAGTDAEKEMRSGGFMFLWDLASNSGFVISEALQAYAPMTGDMRPTNVVYQAGGATDAMVQMSDGSSAVFRVTRTLAPPAPPVRITAVSNSPPLALTLSKIRLGVVPADVFAPPAGFARFSSPEVLADELALRQQNLRRKTPPAP
jgi:hypothetical protein